MTHFSDAVKKRNLQLVKLLIEKGDDVNAQDSKGWTPLHWAAFSTRLKSLEELEESKAFKVLKFLIESGKADVEAKNKEGETPLHLAAKIGNLEAVTFLIEHGANVNAQDEEKMTPLHYAAENGRKDIVELMRKNAPSANILCYQKGIEEYSKASNIGR